MPTGWQRMMSEPPGGDTPGNTPAEGVDSQDAAPQDQGNRPVPEPLPPPPPTPPDALKPWYYQGWFIVPTFVWWPCSAILFIRSPWHNGVVSGALSWAWLIVGGAFGFLRIQLNREQGEPWLDPTLMALAAPGIALTIVTQTLWLLKDRPRIRRIRAAGGFAAYAEPGDADGNGLASISRPEPAAPRRRSNRRRVRRRRR